jgi:hypothetical protein
MNNLSKSWRVERVVTDLEYGKSRVSKGVEAGVKLSVLISSDLSPLKAHPVPLQKIADAINLWALHPAEQSDSQLHLQPFLPRTLPKH